MRLDDFLRGATRRLAEAGVEQPRRDARLLLSHALGVGPEALIAAPERRLSASETAAAEDLLARRTAREPVSRIVGRREFWSLTFALAPATFDPRPATETLVEAALGALGASGAAPKVLDLGTGSGCLLLSVLSALPAAEGLGIDIDEACLAMARQNAATLGLGGRARFCRGDWGAGLAPGWDVILCNPPYVRRDEIATLAPEVADHEPLRALDGGPDGLDPYRRALPQVADLLAPGGFAVFEVGPGQADPVAALVGPCGLRLESRHRDLSGLERCLLVRGVSPERKRAKKQLEKGALPTSL